MDEVVQYVCNLNMTKDINAWGLTMDISCVKWDDVEMEEKEIVLVIAVRKPATKSLQHINKHTSWANARWKLISWLLRFLIVCSCLCWQMHGNFYSLDLPGITSPCMHWILQSTNLKYCIAECCFFFHICLKIQ